jgi:YD repeat-containing protein
MNRDEFEVNNRLTNMVDAEGTTRYAYTDFGALLSEDSLWATELKATTYEITLANL